MSEQPAAGGAAIPYLAVRDAWRALDWYVDVLGGQRRGQPIEMPDGRLGHAEIAFPTGLVYLADEFPDLGVTAPRPDGVPVTLVLPVPDVDATVAAVVAAGGRMTREAHQAHGTRTATFVDPFGHRWLLQAPLPTTAPAAPAAPTRPQHGGLAYALLWVPDAGRAAGFYQAVLGWTYAAGHGPDERQVIGTTPALGIQGGKPRGDLFCCWAVDDVAAAVMRVRAAGGQASEPATGPYGLVANCVDDQGTAFGIYQTPAVPVTVRDGGTRPSANGTREGDLSYLTLKVIDAARARDFYGTVLGWRFSPGSVEQGWQVDNVVPMTGLWGGHPQATSVPMWLVDDIASAVERTRLAGGSSTDPQREPYGLRADCADDQGTPFHLGQHPD
ncbi:MAG TPA: VOC family protein [Mycobacteriales bacterium]